MSRTPCQTCRRYDEHGDPLGDLRATAPGERKPCAEPRCREGWIELEECDGCHQEVEHVYQHDGESLCEECLEERAEAAPLERRVVEMLNLVDYAAQICGMKR